MERVVIPTAGEPVCEIIIADGIAAEAAVALPPRPNRRCVAVLTQPAPQPIAAALAAELRSAGYEAAVKVLPDREAAKTLAVAEDVYLWLNSLGMTRSDTVMAVGGGAATDLGGFVGATYLRGVETVLVPTTMLGAVDAAIGGKTAVNVGGKNLAGVFWHPARVVIDTAILSRLPRPLLVEGTAEAIKAGFIADPVIMDLYQRHGLAAPIAEVVNRAVRVKAEIVSADFTEAGRRAVLNYGHTVGHAVEYLAGIPHGHAVAIGMVAAGAVAAQTLGFTGFERQRDLLLALELPTAAPSLASAAVEEALLLDKKRDRSGLRMVLLEDFGKPIVEAVDMTTVRAGLSAVGIG